MSVAEDLKTHGILVPTGKFQGYVKNQRPDPDPELTKVGPGTPCGEYLRLYWQPVCMTSEIPEDRPLRLRILGEDLVAFQDKSGRYGLLAANCSHRQHLTWNTALLKTWASAAATTDGATILMAPSWRHPVSLKGRRFLNA